MHFDSTVSAGTLITLIGVLASFVVTQRQNANKVKEMHEANQTKLKELDAKVGTIFIWFEENVLRRPRRS